MVSGEAAVWATTADDWVSIRFEVRGGFRLEIMLRLSNEEVSIRFEVRGGFRQQSKKL